MAIGKTSGNSNKNLFSVRVVTKDKDKKPVDPYFSFTQKVDGKYTEVQQSNNFDGNVTDVSTKIEDYQGQPIKKVIVKVEDANDVYYLEFNYTILSRSVFNSLLTITLGDHVKFSLYQTKPNKDNKRFPQVSLWRAVEGQQEDEMIRWKYQMDELPPVKKVRVKGQDISDTEDVDNFFEAELQKVFGGKKTSKTPTPAKPAEEVSKKPTKAKAAKFTPTEDEDSDIPF